MYVLLVRSYLGTYSIYYMYVHVVSVAFLAFFRYVVIAVTYVARRTDVHVTQAIFNLGLNHKKM